MDAAISIGILENLKTILVYLILILFLIDLAKADSYNKIARIIKILLFPLLFVFNIHYKKINVGLLFAALLVNGIFSGENMKKISPLQNFQFSKKKVIFFFTLKKMFFGGNSVF